ncbi:MAG: hypothetical protein FWD77_10220 [Betaproteobacteria bacterium]|nr:hypothetical protein [Betaproteobacteria bacterium]
MRLQRWILMFLLSGFIAAPAAAFKLKPGEWEVSDADAVEKVCLSPQEAENVFEATYMDVVESLCPPDDCLGKIFGPECHGKVTRKPHSYDYKAVCEHSPGKMKLEMRVEKISNTEVFTKTHMQMQRNSSHETRKNNTGIGPLKMEERRKKISEDETLVETRTEWKIFRNQKDSELMEAASRFRKVNDNEFVEHLTIQYGNASSSPPLKMTKVYRYTGPSCSNPLREAPQPEVPASGKPPANDP